MTQSKPKLAPQISVPATYMRGGTSKGTFFKLSDLPERCQVAGKARDNFLLRVIGSQILMVSKSMAWATVAQVRQRR